MPISAMSFSRRLAGDKERQPHFGTDSIQAAAVLREIAADLEAGNCYLQSARVTGLASNPEFVLTSLRLVFAETSPRPSEDADVAELRDGESTFPHAVAPTS